MNMKKIFAAIAATAISATSFAAMSLSANAADPVAQAYICGQMGTYHQWEIADAEANGSTVATIDGNAQYEATWDITGDGTGTMEFVILKIQGVDGADFTADVYPDLSVTIDEVTIDGTPYAITDNAGAYNLKWYEGSGHVRVFLTETWGNVNGGVDLGVQSAVTSQVKVKFTVGGLYNDGTSNVTPDEQPTEATDATTTAADNNDNKSTTTTTTGKKANGGKTESSTKTGDAGVGIAVAAIAVAGAAAFVARKKD